MRFCLGVAAALLALLPAPAGAARSEVYASAGIVAPYGPYPSYRFNAELLGYDRGSVRTDFIGELGYLRAVNWWLTVGPVARFYVGRLSAPYDGVAPIDLYAASIAARFEADLYPWPRLFLWFDPSIGVGSIGAEDARKTLGYWGLQGGLGIGTSRDKSGVRFRAGWGYAPTFVDVTPLAGTHHFGGFMFMLDGVLHVGR
ncbi:MAG: hypothetical protein HYV09_30255 [Deltaproteobacteria bacterium]|nr:hypothetical protein [Deltaproteobacteria bacterium]